MTYKKEKVSQSLGRKEIFIFERKTWAVFAQPFIRNVGCGKHWNWMRALWWWIFSLQWNQTINKAEGCYPKAWGMGAVSQKEESFSPAFFFPFNLTSPVLGSYAVPVWTTLVYNHKQKTQVEMLREVGEEGEGMCSALRRMKTFSDH